MSLGLPEFGSRYQGTGSRGPWWAIRLIGILALAYAGVVAAIEWRGAAAVESSLKQARAEVVQARQNAEETRRWLVKNSDLLVATASLESTPAAVLEDLDAVRPEGVSIVGLKIEYAADGSARLDLTAVARNAETYDRFLSALSGSPRFDEIKPGSEIRPGLVKAAIGATHRPARKEGK